MLEIYEVQFIYWHIQPESLHPELGLLFSMEKMQPKY